ncbi:MAG TPA: flippase-like domain-containing protein [Bacteroidota bacterium]|nr:flippase-like domain-containing protein [Bacteroidota bacterium]
MLSSRSRSSLLTWSGGLLVGTCIVMWAFRDSNVVSISRLLLSMKASALVILIPFLAIVFMDSIAWRILFRVLGVTPPLGTLAVVRTAGEAIVLTMPGGVAAAESLKPILLQRTMALDISIGSAAVFAKKCFVAVSQGTYVLVGLIAGSLVLTRWQTELAGKPLFTTAMAVAGFVLFAAGIGGLMVGFSGPGSPLMQRLIRLAPTRKWDLPVRSFLERTSDAMKGFRRLDIRDAAKVLGLLIVAWLLESVESYLTLMLLGVRMPFQQVLPIEIGVSLLRSLVFVVPGGIGVQELSIATLFSLAGISDPVNTAAAFTVLRRMKELIIVVSGLGMIAFIMRKKKAAPLAEHITGE